MEFEYRGKIFRKAVYTFKYEEGRTKTRFFLETDTIGGSVLYEFPKLETMGDSEVPESAEVKEMLDRECFTTRVIR